MILRDENDRNFLDILISDSWNGGKLRRRTARFASFFRYYIEALNTYNMYSVSTKRKPTTF